MLVNLGIERGYAEECFAVLVWIEGDKLDTFVGDLSHAEREDGDWNHFGAEMLCLERRPGSLMT